MQANGSVAADTSARGLNGIIYQDSLVTGTSSESNLCNSSNVIVTCSSSSLCKKIIYYCVCFKIQSWGFWHPKFLFDWIDIIFTIQKCLKLAQNVLIHLAHQCEEKSSLPATANILS